jgi:hypothetical protein
MIRWLSLLFGLALMPLVATAQSDEEIAHARAFLDRLQVRSLIENREYCGYFARDPENRLVSTRPVRGKYNSCRFGAAPPQLRLLASYHTHAAYDPDSINEIPSLQDLTSDIESGLDGYVSTPGGRLWFSDHEAREVRQLCGHGCLTQDPNFRPGKARKVRRVYTLADLEWLMGP